MALLLDEFFAGLGMVSASAQLDDNTSASTTGGGSLNRASYGTRMWYGTVTLQMLQHADADKVAAKIQYLQEADAKFRLVPAQLLKNTRQFSTITAIDATDRRSVSLDDLLSEGDIFDVDLGGGRRSMHRVVMVTNAGAKTHLVVPALPYAAEVADVIGYGKPEINAVLNDASLASYNAILTGTASFSWGQVY